MTRILAVLAVAAPIVALGYVLPVVTWRRKQKVSALYAQLIDSMER